jgi:hypothetical protein
MEGKGEGFFSWRPMEGEGEGPHVWWPMEGEREGYLSPFPTFPLKQLYLNLCFFSFDIEVLLYHGSRPLFMHFLPFPWLVNYDRIF